jgi:carboxypeptidase C (cathepsin A)
MKKLFLLFGILFIAFIHSNGQKAAADEGSKAPAVLNRMVKTDTAITSKGQVTIKGQQVPYTATAGTMPVWDEDGKAIAGVFYTYYERTDVKDKTFRPLVISFNGGPGTPSVWMEIGYTGPRILNVDDEGYPIQPYGMHDNPHSVLDVG